jgi:hypothetical protein
MCEFTFTACFDAFLVIQRTTLMEDAEEVVELHESPRVLNKEGPVATRFSLAFEFINNLREVPWEGEHVCMFLLGKNLVDTDTRVLGFDTVVLSLGLLHDCVGKVSLLDVHEFELTGLEAGKSLSDQCLAGTVGLQEHSAS